MTVRIVGIVDLVQYIYVTLDAKKKQGGRDFFLYGHEGQRENNLFRLYATTRLLPTLHASPRPHHMTSQTSGVVFPIYRTLGRFVESKQLKKSCLNPGRHLTHASWVFLEKSNAVPVNLE